MAPLVQQDPVQVEVLGAGRDWFDYVAPIAPVLVALVALAIGEFLAQKRFARQVSEQQTTAEKRWQRERDLEARKWAVAQRRDAYGRFISTTYRTIEALQFACMGYEDSEEFEERRNRLVEAEHRMQAAFDEMRLVATDECGALAADVRIDMRSLIEGLRLEAKLTHGQLADIAAQSEVCLNDVVHQARMEVVEL